MKLIDMLTKRDSSQPQSPQDRFPDEQPRNFVTVTKSVVSGKFLIDPMVEVTSSFLPPLGENGIRWNLSLTSQSTERLDRSDVDIYLDHGKQRANASQRTMMLVHSNCGAMVSLRVRPGRHKRAPYLLQVSARDSARVYLPEDFRGMLRLLVKNGRGSIHVSNGISKQISTDNDTGTARMCFIGKLKKADGEGEWLGDEVKVEIEPQHNGETLSVQYIDPDDEVEPRVQCVNQ